LVAAFLAVAVVAGLLYSHAVLSRQSPTNKCTTAPNTSPIARNAGRLGSFTEYSVPANLGYVGDITAGPDGSLWFIGGGAHNGSGDFIVKVTTSGTFTEYAVPTAFTSLSAIAAGPDGNIWFTERFGVPGLIQRGGPASGTRTTVGKVAKVTTSGTFTEYTIPTVDTSPGGITAGPDCNLWFTDQGTNKVVKVTTSGSFTEYTIPTAHSAPGAITTGPDGNLWFIEFTAGKLARVTTSGRITEFALPTAGRPVGIAAGPDGNLWITERGLYGGGQGGKVAKVTTSGVFTEYTVPNPNGFLGLITAGPDGNLWFSDGATIDRVTTSGSFTEYVIPTTTDGVGSTEGITAGPDGNIWFTEHTGLGQHDQVNKLVALPART
jgi:virginiamycin B lyase